MTNDVSLQFSRHRRLRLEGVPHGQVRPHGNLSPLLGGPRNVPPGATEWYLVLRHMPIPVADSSRPGLGPRDRSLLSEPRGPALLAGARHGGGERSSGRGFEGSRHRWRNSLRVTAGLSPSDGQSRVGLGAEARHPRRIHRPRPRRIRARAGPQGACSGGRNPHALGAEAHRSGTRRITSRARAGPDWSTSCSGARNPRALGAEARQLSGSRTHRRPTGRNLWRTPRALGADAR